MGNRRGLFCRSVTFCIRFSSGRSIHARVPYPTRTCWPKLVALRTACTPCHTYGRSAPRPSLRLLFVLLRACKSTTRPRFLSPGVRAILSLRCRWKIVRYSAPALHHPWVSFRNLQLWCLGRSLSVCCGFPTNSHLEPYAISRSADSFDAGPHAGPAIAYIHMLVYIYPNWCRDSRAPGGSKRPIPTTPRCRSAPPRASLTAGKPVVSSLEIILP